MDGFLACAGVQRAAEFADACVFASERTDFCRIVVSIHPMWSNVVSGACRMPVWSVQATSSVATHQAVEQRDGTSFGRGLGFATLKRLTGQWGIWRDAFMN